MKEAVFDSGFEIVIQLTPETEQLDKLMRSITFKEDFEKYFEKALHHIGRFDVEVKRIQWGRTHE